MPISVSLPEDPETLADAIRRMSRGMEKLNRSGINREAVIVLLCHTTKLGRKPVEYVLNSLEDLERRYTTPVKK